jgi:hypothetical protein
MRLSCRVIRISTCPARALFASMVTPALLATEPFAFHIARYMLQRPENDVQPLVPWMTRSLACWATGSFETASSSLVSRPAS